MVHLAAGTLDRIDPIAKQRKPRATPELIQRGRNTLNELATEAGREPASIEVMAYLAPTDRAKLEALEEAGTDSATIMLSKSPESAALEELEQAAQEVF